MQKSGADVRAQRDDTLQQYVAHTRRSGREASREQVAVEEERVEYSTMKFEMERPPKTVCIYSPSCTAVVRVNNEVVRAHAREAETVRTQAAEQSHNVSAKTQLSVRLRSTGTTRILPQQVPLLQLSQMSSTREQLNVIGANAITS